MKRRIIILLCLTLALFAACRKQSPAEQTYFSLYFLATGDQYDMAALQTEASEFPLSTPPTPEEMIQALLRGPTSGNLVSAFPEGLSLLSCQWAADKTQVLNLTLSEQYGGLSDISLTLADYCIVLTLVQLPNVNGIEITADGRTTSYLDLQTLTDSQALFPELGA